MLFEAGYISNADDELLLRDPEQRAQDRACAGPGDRSRRRRARSPLSRLSATASEPARRLRRMKFERLTVPDWPLPDLVAFNREGARARRPVVGARVGPPGHLGRARRCSPCSPRCGSISRAACRRRRRCSPTSRRCRPTCAAMTATPVQTFARERRVELPMTNFRRWSSTPSSRPRTRPSSRHGGIDYPGPDRRGRSIIRRKSVTGGGRAQGRIDHHPAGRQISAAGHRATISAARSARRSSPSGWNRR